MLGITMGDASGVGPEIILNAYKRGELPQDCIVIGDYEILVKCQEMLKLRVPMSKVADVSTCQQGSLNIYDMALMQKSDLAVGRISRISGYAALKYVEHATELALNHHIAAMVTLPMSKEATRLSEASFTGHTEHIARICDCKDYAMMLVSSKLIVTHVSTHVSQKEAIEKVKADRVYNVIRLTADTIKKLRSQERIAVAGLNPHASEGGSFGCEDLQEIEPAVLRADNEGLNVSGPFPPDTVFYQAINGKYDAVVCMYHDQGHIPIKLLDFEGAVNTTLGLQIVRTSVDHGTAFDIAYKGVASTRSFSNACELAIKLAGE